MAKNITLMGANYPEVPAVVLPQTGGGSAVFADADEFDSIEGAIAIVINGDTAPQGITSGQYLFIKNHSTLASGGYHATSDIASGGTISSSNVAADANGITNAINSKFTTELGKDVTITPYSGVSIINSSVSRCGKMVCGTVNIAMTVSPNEWKNVFQISPAPSEVIYVPMVRTGNGSHSGMAKFYANTAVQIYSTQALNNNEVAFTFAYKTA